MVCPLYVDFTRMCLEKFPAVVKFSTVQTCRSEQYIDCPIYQVCNSGFVCEYMPHCSKQYSDKFPKLLLDIFMKKNISEILRDIWTNYCLSPENSKICARYKLYSKGEMASITIMPDGQSMSPFDFIFDRKLSIPPRTKQ